MTEQQQVSQDQLVPGAMVAVVPSAMDLRVAPDGKVILFVNSVNGAFWFPMDAAQSLPFFEAGVRLCQQAKSNLIIPQTNIDLSALRK